MAIDEFIKWVLKSNCFKALKFRWSSLIHSYICSICRRKNRARQSKQQTLPNHGQRTRRNWSHTLPHCYPWCLRLPERVPPNWTGIQLPRYQINCRSDVLSAKRAISCSHVLEEVDQWTWHAIWVLIVESIHRSMAGFQMTSSKIQTRDLPILLSFYFHKVSVKSS